MKYTYQISFNGSDYVSLYPNSDLEMNGEWETGTKIWREKISELKITKALNDTVYTTLETYFEDSDYFETRIYVKVLKNAVQDSVHYFGIKWGALDKHLTTYTVEPDVYDLYGQYLQANMDLPTPVRVTSAEVYYYFDTTTNYPSLGNVSIWTIPIKEAVKDIIVLMTDWAYADVVSSFMWQDAYEDASAVGTYQGMPLDYVTGEESYLSLAGIITPINSSISDVLEWMKIFNVLMFFDSNDKLRFEHISFFNDRLDDNAVSFASYIKDYDEKWSYEDVNIPTAEIIKMNSDDASGEDFRGVSISYSNVRNRPDAQTYEFTSGLYSDLNEMGTDSDLALFGANENSAYAWFDTDMASFSTDKNTLNITSDSVPQYCGTNDFNCGLTAYDFTINATTCSGAFDFYIVDRSTTSQISNTISVSSTGETTGTITTTSVQPDAYLVCESTSTGSLVGWITLNDDYFLTVPNIEGTSSGSVQTNGAMSTANIVESWWQDDRLSKEGTLFDTAYTFNGTQYNLRRETIKIHYSGVINPLFGFNDGTRVGMIDKWTRSLDTDFYEIDVIYPEDE